VAVLCLAQVLSLAGYSAVPALLPQFISNWSLSNTEAGWLAGAFFVGYMCAVIPLVALTDRRPARQIYVLSALLNIFYYLGFASIGGFLPALPLQLLGGIALAGMYMPGLRAITAEARGSTRSRIVALYTSSFTIGVGLSFLLAGRLSMLGGWRAAFIGAGACATAAAILAAIALPRPAASAPAGSPRLLDVPAVLRNRQAMAFIIAYAAVIWSSVGIRNWTVLFFHSHALGKPPPAMESWITLGTASAINLLGVPAALLGSELAIRFGLRRTAAAIFLASTFAGGLFGFAAVLPYFLGVGLALVCAFIIQGNFANLTAGLIEAAEPERAGATVALYSFIGFAGSFLGPLTFGATLDRFGGAASATAWEVAFGTCGLAAFVGALAVLVPARRDGA
jgi:MFS family permease